MKCLSITISRCAQFAELAAWEFFFGQACIVEAVEFENFIAQGFKDTAYDSVAPAGDFQFYNITIGVVF